ncbi:MAG: flippase [Nanoarchaeota archaeon]|nr:flippase [Nanoarchaeota archaeon]
MSDKKRAKREKIEFDKSLKLLAGSSIIVFVSIILSKLFTYLYRIIVARYYGPEVYGLFALSLMIIGWFIVFGGLGLNHGLIRFIPLYRGGKKKKYIPFIFQRVFVVLIITSFIASIILFLSSEFIATSIFKNEDLTLFLKLFSFTLPLTILSGSFLSAIRAHEKINGHSFISRIFDTGIKLILVAALIFYGVGILAIPLSYLIGGLATLLISYFYCKSRIPRIFMRIKNKVKKERIIKDIFSYSWPLIFFGFAVSLLHWTDTLMIGVFRSIEEVGFYNAAIPIALLITISIDLFRQLFFPLVTREYYKGNKEIVKQLSQQVGKWVFILSLPIFALLVLFPGLFINILFGEEYLVAENALRFLSIGAMFIALFEVSKELLSMRGKSKLILFDIVSVVIINLVLNLIFVPLYGITGAAFATMISLALLGTIYAFQTKKILGIVPLRRKMLRITAVVVFASVVILVIRSLIEINIFSIIILGILFFLIYVIGIFVTKSLDKNDYLVLNLIKRKFIKGKKVPIAAIHEETKDL